MRIVDVLVVWGGGDAEGRNQNIIGVCSTILKAEDMKKGKGGYGGDGRVENRLAVLLDDGTACLIDRAMTIPVEMNVDIKEQREKMIADAKAKLTDVELKLLGLKK